MRRAAKTDDNQAEIVDALRRAGCSVVSLAAVGDGVHDLLVGRAGENYLLEVKDGSKPPSATKLTPDQQRFHAIWAGQGEVVMSPDEALVAVGIKSRGEENEG